MDIWLRVFDMETNFRSEKKVVGQIPGFARKFWQGSIGHREVPGKVKIFY